MNVANTTIDSSPGLNTGGTALMSEPLNGANLAIGSGFNAQSFRAQDIGKAMDPLVMVDHYVMTETTFGTHPHAGLSAVSLIFPDSEGRFRNRDSLGNDFDLLPGDLYWLMAGRGALHNESPTEGSRTHGLQVFVNIPQAFRYEEPSSLLVRRQDMPVIANSQHSVRVALGVSNGIEGASSPGLPMTILNGELVPDGSFEHEVTIDRNIWVHAIDGEISVTALSNEAKLRQGQAVAIDNTGRGESITVRISARNQLKSQFVLLDGPAVKEPYVQQGPFVMGSQDEIESINRAFVEGSFGSVD